MQNDTPSHISYEDFLKVNMHVGTVIAAEINSKAKKPAYFLHIDFGPYGIKTSSAQITQHYQAEKLIGQQIIAVINFLPKLIAGKKSEVLVLGSPSSEEGIVLLQPTQPVPNGSRVF